MTPRSRTFTAELLSNAISAAAVLAAILAVAAVFTSVLAWWP
jgi:hypothetical protein